ncbi:argininosuccinate synthase ArgG [Gottschalkia acidurici 9a]|uniref:Argininosuccinate synthase n=2 Tax=Clostridium acidurici TaxID=1556 RepID=K0AZG1_GOTA9|nr:argininosuccinate synthase ArgG [Gottschalkia acidurici 9a]
MEIMGRRLKMKEKVVLAYSGGLDTSIVIPWLKENYNMEIIAACINVGQDDDMDKVREKAIESGASKIYIEDVKEEFVKDYVFKAIKANAVYEDKYLMGTAVARPLIAKKLVEIAHKEGAKYICHGCTGKGNDQVRFEAGIASIDSSIQIIAPWRIWDISSREDAIDYANQKGISVPVTKEKIYSRDMNLMHISHEGGHLEDPKNEHKAEELYLMTKTLEQAKDEPTYIELHFEKGVPTKLDGKAMSPAELLGELNRIGGENGVGIVDILENRLVGMKSRGVYESPGATILMEAHKDLEKLTLDKMTYHFKQTVAIKYGELVYDGLWFSQLKEALDAFIDSTQETVTGWIKLKLYKGNIMIAGMDSPNALYDEQISSFGASDLYDHKDADGFIKLFTLPLKIRSMAKNK